MSSSAMKEARAVALGKASAGCAHISCGPPMNCGIAVTALVLGGDEDLMTPWDQGPEGAGQEAIYQGIHGAEKHVIAGSGHSTIFDNPAEHNRVVIDFFGRNAIGVVADAPGA